MGIIESLSVADTKLKHSGWKMKSLAHYALLLGAVTLSQSAWADTGPFYVSYPGYCEVKRIYINTRNDLYGTEVSCPSILGKPLVGTLMGSGGAMVATVESGIPCIAAYSPAGAVLVGCSAGGPVGYAASSNFVVRQSIDQKQSEHQFVVSTEMPNVEATKNLPRLGL